MIAWTDYPFTWLGDAAGEEAPIREIIVISYDDNKYCKIKIVDREVEIKSGYIYQRKGRYGKVPCISRRQLALLSPNAKLTGGPSGPSGLNAGLGTGPERKDDGHY